MIKRKLTYREAIGMLKEDKDTKKIVITNVPNLEAIDALIADYKTKIGEIYCVENEEGYNDDDYFLIVPEEFSDIRQNVVTNLTNKDAYGRYIFEAEKYDNPTDFYIALPAPGVGEKIVNVRILGYFGNKILDIVEKELKKYTDQLTARDKEFSDAITFNLFKASADGMAETIKEESKKDKSLLVASVKDIEDVFLRGITEDPETRFEGAIATGYTANPSCWGVIDEQVPTRYLELLEEAIDLGGVNTIYEPGMYKFTTNENRVLYYLVEKYEGTYPDYPTPPVDEPETKCPGTLAEGLRLKVNGAHEGDILDADLKALCATAATITDLSQITEDGMYRFFTNKGVYVYYYVEKKSEDGPSGGEEAGEYETCPGTFNGYLILEVEGVTLENVPGEYQELCETATQINNLADMDSCLEPAAFYYVNVYGTKLYYVVVDLSI